MLPLPLILCYINYIFLQTYTVPVASAPGIHGNSQWVPSLRHTHPHCKPALQECKTDVTNKTAERSLNLKIRSNLNKHV